MNQTKFIADNKDFIIFADLFQHSEMSNITGFKPIKAGFLHKDGVGYGKSISLNLTADNFSTADILNSGHPKYFK